MSSNVSEGAILGLGNPLLDVSAIVQPDLLTRYNMKANDAILASDEHKNLCVDMSSEYDVEYIAGGAVQNSIRVAQWFFKESMVGTFFGGVGKDANAELMRKKAAECNVRVSYQVDDEVPTGTCACLITSHGKNRSLVAYLGASQKFCPEYLKKNMDLIEKSKIIYTSGFHLMVSIEASLFLAQHAHSNEGKLFTFNLSAPYISHACQKELNQILPYVDILFGNETEAVSYSTVKGWNTENIPEIAQKLADGEHKRERMVIITQGSEDIVVAFTGQPTKLRHFPVTQLSESEIVDTNGAGDSFVGGFLAYKLAGKSLEECIEAGIYAAKQIIKMSGCTLPQENKMRL